MPKNYLRCLDYATVLRYRYSTIDHKIMPILYSTYYRFIDQDHTPFMLAAFVATHLQVGRLIQDTLVYNRNTAVTLIEQSHVYS